MHFVRPLSIFTRLFAFGLIYLFSFTILAQEAQQSSENEDIKSIENLLEKNVKFEAPPAGIPKSTVKTPKKVDYKESEVLGNYQDMAVIQKNYMPKASRFALTIGPALSPTDVYFRTFGMNAKLNYYFDEFWAAEVTGHILTSSARSEVKDLEQNQSLIARDLISLRSLFGVNLNYSSIYGKTSILNRKIIPFEIYETVGLGKVSNQNGAESTSFQVGVGELFSISRSSAFRTDLTWAFYRFDSVNGAQNGNSILLSFNYTFFFGEPTYR